MIPMAMMMAQGLQAMLMAMLLVVIHVSLESLDHMLTRVKLTALHTLGGNLLHRHWAAALLLRCSAASRRAPLFLYR